MKKQGFWTPPFLDYQYWLTPDGRDMWDWWSEGLYINLCKRGGIFHVLVTDKKLGLHFAGSNISKDVAFKKVASLIRAQVGVYQKYILKVQDHTDLLVKRWLLKQ